MRFRQSNWAVLTGPTSAHVPKQVLTGIRDAMLYALGEFSPVHHFLLDMEITFADDIDELWKLRRELFDALKASKGERFATDRIQVITQKFVGFHPDAKVGPKVERHAISDTRTKEQQTPYQMESTARERSFHRSDPGQAIK